MAIENRYPVNRQLITSLPFEPPAFQRSRQRVKSRTLRGKKTLALKQTGLIFLAILFFFFLLSGAYYYAITSEQLKIKQVTVNCSLPELKQKVESYLANKNLGNILICNLDFLRTTLTQIPGVKEVHLEKILPSTLKIEVFPRTPKVYVHKENYWLVDEEGQVISTQNDEPPGSFPLLEDENGFNDSYFQKIASACRALDNLQPEVRSLIKKITFQDERTMEIQLDGDPAKIILEENDFADKLNYYLNHRNSWTQLFGQLEYVDLRIGDRAYLKPVSQSGGTSSAEKKEAS
ncbi:MAG: cell division protein FtsQ/DivIB [Candidatus Aminicenantes bacterium]|jgi:cell division septal protein FtsQ|nr:cell division protein FtsQ/DivIB [Candidatus Aminicenantes bacterium]